MYTSIAPNEPMTNAGNTIGQYRFGLVANGNKTEPTSIRISPASMSHFGLIFCERGPVKPPASAAMPMGSLQVDELELLANKLAKLTNAYMCTAVRMTLHWKTSCQ